MKKVTDWEDGLGCVCVCVCVEQIAQKQKSQLKKLHKRIHVNGQQADEKVL